MARVGRLQTLGRAVYARADGTLWYRDDGRRKPVHGAQIWVDLSGRRMRGFRPVHVPFVADTPSPHGEDDAEMQAVILASLQEAMFDGGDAHLPEARDPPAAPAQESTPSCAICMDTIERGQALETSRAQLEASELKQRVQALTAAIGVLEAQLRENAKLLCAQRLPPRPRMSSVERALVAARQSFKCPGPDGDASACPLYTVSGCMFTTSLWEVDHEQPYSESGMHTGNLVARCPCCHAVRTRAQCVARFHRGEAGSDDEDERE